MVNWSNGELIFMEGNEEMMGTTPGMGDVPVGGN